MNSNDKFLEEREHTMSQEENIDPGYLLQAQAAEEETLYALNIIETVKGVQSILNRMGCFLDLTSIYKVHEAIEAYNRTDGIVADGHTTEEDIAKYKSDIIKIHKNNISAFVSALSRFKE